MFCFLFCFFFTPVAQESENRVSSDVTHLLNMAQYKGLAKLENFVGETLIPDMFRWVAKLGNIRFGSKICVCEAKMFLT